MRTFVLLAYLFSVAFGRGFIRSPRANKNIVELAQANKDLSTLVTALKAGNLVDALEAKGPFTVFAPSNEAFAKIPKDKLQWLLDPHNVKELDAILEYHVVSGAAIHSTDLKPEQNLKTIEGGELYVESYKQYGVYINHDKAKVIYADNEASNGVVHIIDHVLMPPKPRPRRKSIIQLAQSNKDLSTLVRILKLANLTSSLEGKGPFTIFAPTNEGFARIPKLRLDAMLKKPAVLASLLSFHILGGEAIRTKDLRDGMNSFMTFNYGYLQLAKTNDGHVFVGTYRRSGNGPARVTSADIGASNGVVHIIDRVMLSG